MATRSTISLEFADGTVRQVYCHWDGYLDCNGHLLLKYWSDPFKLRDLIDQGDLSILSEEIGEKHNFENPYKFGTPDYENHRTQTRHMCTFYGRDRGETGVEARRYDNYQQYLLKAPTEEYNYILRNIKGQPTWFVAYYATNDKFVPLIDAIAVEKAEEEAVE